MTTQQQKINDFIKKRELRIEERNAPVYPIVEERMIDLQSLQITDSEDTSEVDIERITNNGLWIKCKGCGYDEIGGIKDKYCAGCGKKIKRL